MTTQTTSGYTSTSSELDALSSRLSGEILTPGGEAYDAARALNNFTYDRHPSLIVRVKNTADVVETLRYATSRGLRLAIKSGGHSIAGHSGSDGAISIDFGSMKRVVIDPFNKTARVQPGATSWDLAGPANELGLALTTGDTSSVGIAGLTTGGGIGFMARKYGLTIDNLLSAEVVLADGRVVRASKDEYSDLFWAIRGGGGNFGIVTEFEFKLAPVANVLGGALVLPATPEVLRGYLDYVLNAPEDLTTIANVMYAPPAPFIPVERMGELVLMVLIVHTGSIEDGYKAVAPLRALAEPVADAVAEIPYPVIYNFTDFATQRHGAVVRQTFADSVSDQTIEDILDAMKNASSPTTLIQLRGLGGAVSRVPADATAFAHRDAPYFIASIAIWLDPTEDRKPHDEWSANIWSKIAPTGRGAYVNFVSDEGEARIRDAYPSATYARLAEVKRRYDPQNIFRLNQNIKPA